MDNRYKYVIGWLRYRTDENQAYYTGMTHKSSDWDTYGTSPVPTIHSSHYLSQAVVFDTTNEALAEQKIIKSGYTHVMPVTGKELFLAKLKEEPDEA